MNVAACTKLAFVQNIAGGMLLTLGRHHRPRFGLEAVQFGQHTEERTRNKLTKANNKFSAILNFGGSFGSHLHLFGVQETIVQHFPINPFSGIRGNRLSSPEFLVDVGSLASPPISFLWSLLSAGVESGGANPPST